MTLASYGTSLDLRALDPRERHPLVFNTFRALGARESVEFISDHDPRPLKEAFQAALPGGFSWDPLQGGPDVWRVRVTKLAAGHGDGRCCGSCGGA
ncbi:MULTISPECIES: DUF2249 domain-containing protein [Roseateles]|uniref:DUF2249 domain-containing protein n=1 Tax=Pelomonas caseinilytica TaxID=2906763 RepID=A0ABS8XF39_9BURK|nr:MULTISPECIES: DUF2249 domain-containing protein [unclassified Roseateles]MCE4537865.1 DUF2249 domain-containing protein [Pelomonas sp. P7]HEV6965846.1 DUF2249 domain-containing protein [Roseateles sp.]